MGRSLTNVPLRLSSSVMAKPWSASFVPGPHTCALMRSVSGSSTAMLGVGSSRVRMPTSTPPGIDPSASSSAGSPGMEATPDR